MAIQIVMDHTGDTRHPFNPNDAQALAEAEEQFQLQPPSVLEVRHRAIPFRIPTLASASPLLPSRSLHQPHQYRVGQWLYRVSIVHSLAEGT